MSRVQLALNVTDLSESVEFYKRLFGAEPAKLRPGYANFAVDDPPLKLVLIEASEGGTINHLGVEVDILQTQPRRNLSIGHNRAKFCCYAKQDKVWVSDPDRAPWEVYTVLEDADSFGTVAEGACC